MASFRVSRHLVKALWEEGQEEKVTSEQVERVAKWCDHDVTRRLQNNLEVPPLKTMILDIIFLEERLPDETSVSDMHKARELQNISPEIERNRDNGSGQ